MSEQPDKLKEIDEWFANAGLLDERDVPPRYDAKTEREMKKVRERARKENEKLVPSGVTMLETRPANEWFDTEEARSELFGELWHEGEVCILFGDTGKGKSILAAQIGESIARGHALPPLALTSEKQKVLYFDFELTGEQFTNRYSVIPSESGDAPKKYDFSPDLAFSAIKDFSDVIPKIYEKNINGFVLHSIQAELESTGAKVVIIDNITYLSGSTSNAAALRLMKNLKHVAKCEGLSILVLANEKTRRPGPLQLGHIAGSKHLADLADSVFAIGGSTCGQDIRYIKHLKSRSSGIHLDEQNVAVFRIERSLPFSSTPDSPSPFLGFQHLGFSDESFHLIDHAKEALRAEERERKLRLQAQRKSRSLYEYILTGQYTRYLER